MSGNSGQSVPSNPSFAGYTQPANWSSPAVSGQNLMVHTGTLRNAASALSQMASKLQGALSQWQGVGQSAAAGAGSWPAAQSFGHVLNSAYSGVQQFTSQLQQAHSDMAKRLTMSANNYDDNEQALTALANRSTAAGSTIVGANGNNTPVDPTPAQARALDLMHHMEAPGDNENWQASYPITENASFSPGSTSGYSWQQVRNFLQGTNPAAIASAGEMYANLSSALGDVATQLAGQGGQLAGDWGGATAVTAISQVQQLWQTASDLQANTFAAGATMKWYGPVLQTYKDNLPTMAPPQGKNGKPPTQADVATATNAANQQAQQHLAQLNAHMQTAFYNMPGAVNKNLPPPLTSSGGNAPATGGGAGGGPAGGGLPGAYGPAPSTSGGPAPSMGQVPGSTAPPAGSTPPPVGTLPPPGTPPPGYHLSGGTTPIITTGPPGPTGSPGPVGTLPPPGSSGPGPVSVLPPPGSGGQSGPGGGDPMPGGEPGPGGVIPGETGPGGGIVPNLGSPGPVGEPGPEVPGLGTPGIGPDGVITGGSMPGDGARGASSDSLAASGGVIGGETSSQGMMPMMGMPGAGGGAGQGGLGRMRESWTSEDEGTFGPDGTFGGAADGGSAAADGTFPGMMPLGGTGGGQGQERDRSRQAWMAEDEDVWGAGEPAVPPVINLN